MKDSDLMFGRRGDRQRQIIAAQFDLMGKLAASVKEALDHSGAVARLGAQLAAEVETLSKRVAALEDASAKSEA